MMHECPDCGQACDCDGEDVWWDDAATLANCVHDCEPYDEDDWGAPDADEPQTAGEATRAALMEASCLDDLTDEERREWYKNIPERPFS